MHKSNQYFHTINSVNHIYDFSKNVLLPTLYDQGFYNGAAYLGALDPNDADSPAYKPYFFGDSAMTLGKVRSGVKGE